MAAISLSLWHSLLCSPAVVYPHSQLDEPMLPLLFFTLSLLSFALFFLSLYKRLKKADEEQTQTPNQKALSVFRRSLPEIVDTTHQTQVSSLTHLTQSLLLEILPSGLSKWTALSDGEGCENPNSTGSNPDGEKGDSGGEECGKSGDDQRGKKKKKRAKKKRPNSPTTLRVEDNGAEEERVDLRSKEKQELVCLYPFTSSSSATQRKIKQQYDQLMKCHESKGLTLAQVGQFANCLIEARSELLHKSEVIQRKFTITKALLFKADRSSFDRLRQQIYKLELEQKRLEEDAFVYNWLQQQLKLSPAYKKMLEIGACMELKAKSGELVESTDTEFANISFEDFLAQEKKDSFWQKNGKLRSCSSSN
ncbi:uncharacterized protein LOC131164915 [Malania oleifera]|uniref:uncharacterized protein LOC131164915 n=1 Tax=Malania oleifera TaxID=397392 RepID=UPI0025AEB694|nr:uncharacterized protein LOC131164915 [Malania oleifera]